MEKEILLYGGINTYSAEDYINSLEANKRNDITVRVNCPGGEVYAAIGMIAKANELKKAPYFKIDGQAKSGGCFALFGNNSGCECLDVTDFLLHRAAMPSYIENDKERFTDEYKSFLTNINIKLRSIVESKVSASKFQEILGVSLDAMFSLDTRIDVPFNALKAKELGIVTKIVPITQIKKSEIMALALTHGVAAFSKEIINSQSTEIKTSNKMTSKEFKIANPEAYAEILAKGVKNERERVALWSVFAKVDPELVAKAIADGSECNAVAQAQLNLKAQSVSILEAAKNENAPKVKPVAGAETTDANDNRTTEAKAESADFWGKVDAQTIDKTKK